MTRTHWIVAAAIWVCAVLLAFAHRDELAASTVGTLALLALFAPAAIALYALVHVLGEGAVLLLFLGAFKVVTLGQVRADFGEAGLSFPWYGFARADDGALVASEAAMTLIAIAAYAVAGFIGYLFFA
ncbi:hypothetical protein QFZ83_001739 [Variovorax sp. W1I1]|jgi:hypothetical protein|uniref:hypothetical protein n=1 Tax=Variovorax sp. W1I1 TaxID=3042309 RepID=UPI00277E813A|nr:hypothetical protein [Variovorax sp. W1I1]MDQ0607568.1 hypothetical protein [Variovorax sp. W1I1]